MNDPIEKKVNKWELDGDIKVRDTNLKILHLNERLFKDYEVCPPADFIVRLNKWIENVEEDNDQKLLFELVPNIFFIGREELKALYIEAYINNYAKWLIDLANIDFLTLDWENIINTSEPGTWFCPITDSFNVNMFFHINDIPTRSDIRPDWRALITLGDFDAINQYILSHKIKRIVLLEDFVGCGDQTSKTLAQTAEKFKNLHILFIPLIICPKGKENLEKIQNSFSNFRLSPVLTLNVNWFIQEQEIKNSLELFKEISKLSKKVHSKVCGTNTIDDEIEPYGPLGWKNTGGLIVMHTNTPNNTLPLIHNQSISWEPLFKRHKRI